MDKVKEITIEGERIFMRKSRMFGWKVIYPPHKEYNDGKVNWKYAIAGRSWWNLLVVGVMVAIILGCVWEYSQAGEVATECLRQLKLYNPLI